MSSQRLDNEYLTNAVVETEAEPLIKKDGKDYNIFDKNLSIILLEMSARQTTDGFQPNYSLMSKALGIDERKLKSWWKDKKDIQKTAGQTIDIVPNIISQKLKFQTIKALQEVENRGFEAFSNQDLIRFIKEAIQISRLLDNLSTANIAVKTGTDYCSGHVKLR